MVLFQGSSNFPVPKLAHLSDTHLYFYILGLYRENKTILLPENTGPSALICHVVLRSGPLHVQRVHVLYTRIQRKQTRTRQAWKHSSLTPSNHINCAHSWTLKVNVPLGSQTLNRERSGLVVECLTRDRGAAGSSLTGVTALCSLSKTHLS